MRRAVRLFAILLLAVFAAGTAAQGARTTSMSLAMSASAMTDMGDCEHCPPADGDNALSCSQACLVPLAAMPASVDIELPFVAAGLSVSPQEEIVGRTGPPEPYPPRTAIL